MAKKTKDLTLVLEINPTMKIKITHGKNILEALTNKLTGVLGDIKSIQELEIPEDAIEDANNKNREVKQVSIYGHYDPLFKIWDYVVSYQTARGAELGNCKSYSSVKLRNEDK